MASALSGRFAPGSVAPVVPGMCGWLSGMPAPGILVAATGLIRWSAATPLLDGFGFNAGIGFKAIDNILANFGLDQALDIPEQLEFVDADQ